jgi:glycosyltransferase involved in cell wall biosynthesis
MKILHIVPALETGGVETGTIDLALKLKKTGQDIVVVSNGGRLVGDLEKNNILHIKLPVHKKSPLALFLVARIACIIKTQNIDIVHASSRVPALIGFLACKLAGTPFVTSCHGFYSRSPFSYVMGWGRLVMVISKAIEKRMRDAFNVPKEKIRLVYRGVDLSKYDYYPDKYNRQKESLTVINIARLTPIKGQYEFIKAMKRVVDKIKNIEIWIVGGLEPGKSRYLETLKNLTRELGMQKHVKFLGKRGDISSLLKQSDCLVLSTKVPEGFGRTVIEAGATGTAVCASDIGGIKEIIDDGISGLLFPPGDEKDMSEALLKMLNDAGLRRKCASNLRKKVEESFTLDEMARRTLAVYEEAVLR